jgi:hypothetical protein
MHHAEMVSIVATEVVPVISHGVRVATFGGIVSRSDLPN